MNPPKATSSPDKNGPNPLMLIEKGNECAKVHPLMGDMPRPNAYEEGNDEHPHLAFEVDHTIFQSKSNAISFGTPLKSSTDIIGISLKYGPLL